MVSLLKRNNCQKTLYHSRILMECFGGNAASDEYPIARIAANAHVVSTYEGECAPRPLRRLEMMRVAPSRDKADEFRSYTRYLRCPCAFPSLDHPRVRVPLC